MSRFYRTNPPPPTRTKEPLQFREAVRADFECRCAYCLIHEHAFGEGADDFHVEHHRPASKFGALRLDFYNLYWSCHRCNTFKGDCWPSPEEEAEGKQLVDLVQRDVETEYEVSADGLLVACSTAACYTIDRLRLNRESLVLRRAQILRHVCGDWHRDERRWSPDGDPPSGAGPGR